MNGNCFKPFNWWRASGRPRSDAVCVHLPA